MNYISWFGVGLSIAACLGLALAGPGHRLGLWGYKTGINMVKATAYLSIAAIVVCTLGVVLFVAKMSSSGIVPALIGLAAAGVSLGCTLIWKHKLDSLPYIHDITTDTENPPSFVVMLPLRAAAENTAEYGGPEIARQQKDAYPELAAGSVHNPPTAAYSRALQAVKDMGWELVDSNPQTLQIEATDTTRWFGFKDDVVVRITPSSAGSRIDVRSVSRVGKSDLGANAHRIKTFLARVV